MQANDSLSSSHLYINIAFQRGQGSLIVCFMKKIKFFGIASLVVLAAVFTSCSRSNDDPFAKLSDTDKMFAKYIGNYSNITCRTCFYDQQHQFYLLGIKNKHLWFSQFDSTKTLKLTWEDIEKTDSSLIINKGYGAYDTIRLRSIVPLSSNSNYNNFPSYVKTETGTVVTLKLSYDKMEKQSNIIIFTSNNKSIRKDIGLYGYLYRWYGNSVMIHYEKASNNYCYSQTGDSLYATNSIYNSIYNSNELRYAYFPVSDEEGIRSWSMGIYRDNLKTGKNVWTTGCKAPFDIPTDAKPQYTCRLLDKSTDIWKYKVDMVYYDGTKKEFTFTININTGEYKASV